MARIQCRPQRSKAADTGAQSMRYGDSAAVINVAWLVIGKYRDAKAQPATTSATKPIAVWGILLIFDTIVHYLSSALSVRRGAPAQPPSHERLDQKCGAGGEAAGGQAALYLGDLGRIGASSVRPENP